MINPADAIDLGLIILDRDGRIVQCNAWMRRNSRIAGNPVGGTLEDAFSSEIDPHLRRAIGTALTGGMASRLSHALHPAPLPLYPDGDISQAKLRQAVDLIPLPASEGERLCLIQVRDVSEMVKREQLLKAQARQLNDEVRKLEESKQALAMRTAEAEAANGAKDVFLSVVTHELRSPLHTILGYTDLVSRELDEPAAVSQLEIVKRSGRQLMRIIDDMLEFTRGKVAHTTLDVRAFSVSDFVARISSYAGNIARGKDVPFSIEVARNFPELLVADEQRLTQVVTNLIDNAFKFSDGAVRTRFGIAAGDPPPEGGTCAIPVEISVEDEGPGIAEAELSRIFAPFYRLPSSRYQSGLGLGLSIVHQIATAMKGTVGVENRAGGGSRFTVVVPLSAAANTSMPLEPQLAMPIGYQGRRLVACVVDDIEEHRHLLSNLLSRLGFDVVEATGAKDAIAVLARQGSRIDLMLVDQFMPDGTGWDVLEFASEGGAGATVPTILVSASEAKRPAGYSRNLGFAGELRKPLSQLQLVSMIDQLFGMSWLYPEEPAGDRRMADLKGLSAGQIEELSALSAEGRITLLRERVEAMLESGTSAAALCHKLIELADRVDLPAIEALLTRPDR